MWIGIAVVLVIVWLVSFLALHITGALIHLLLVVALISLVIHFVAGRSSTV
jgi:hypothetical protein